jgi:hypothetical protein
MYDLETEFLKVSIKSEMENYSNDESKRKLEEHINNDDDVDRLKRVLSYIRYCLNRREKEMKMNQREYNQYTTRILDVEIREMKRRGIEIEGWGKYKKANSKIKLLFDDRVYCVLDKAINHANKELKNDKFILT